MFQKLIGYVLAGVFTLASAGCGSLQCQYQGDEAEKNSSVTEPVMRPKSITVTGYGALDPGIGNPTQQRLMGLRASKVDAYRALAERVRGIQISSSSKVADFITQFDHLNAMVDGYVSQAKVLSQTVDEHGACSTILALEIDSTFYRQMDSMPVTPQMDSPMMDSPGDNHPNSAKGEEEAPLATQAVGQSQHQLVDPTNNVEVELWDD